MFPYKLGTRTPHLSSKLKEELNYYILCVIFSNNRHFIQDQTQVSIGI